LKDSYTGIIEQLEHQKTAIDRALSALRDIDAEPATEPQIEPVAAPTAPTRKRSAAVRRRMALAQQARWAKLKGETAPPSSASPAPEPPPANRQISTEGMKRIVAATKKRWRLQKAAAKAALAENAAPKTVAVRKAVAPAKKTAKKVAPVKRTMGRTVAAPAFAKAQTAG
jgi:hypothetical protein